MGNFKVIARKYSAFTAAASAFTLAVFAAVTLMVYADPVRQARSCLEHRDYSHAVEIYNDKLADTHRAEKLHPELLQAVEDTVVAWNAGQADYETTVSVLQTLKEISNAEIAQLSGDQLLCVTVQHHLVLIENHLLEGDYAEAVVVFNEMIAGTVHRDEAASLFLDSMDEIDTAWEAGTADPEACLNALQEMQKLNAPAVAKLAEDKAEYIAYEADCQKYLQIAEENYDQCKYADAFRSIQLVGKKYSKYSMVQDLYNLCREKVLASVAAPVTITEYEGCITLLNECLDVASDEEMQGRRAVLVQELIAVKAIEAVIDDAAELFDAKHYAASFVMLADGLKEFPDSELLADTLVDYHDHYIISVTQQVADFCKQEKYSDALKMVEEALSEYECEEFHLLEETVKELKNPLYKFKNSAEDKFKALAKGWEAEELDVKQLANDAGAFVMKSGEKVLLGDYSDKEVTLLSTAGNVVASVANIDLLMDLRDLTYDIQHWGEGEYYLLHLATDVIAILPVIGVTKYLKHFDEMADSWITTNKLADSVADVTKNTTDAEKIADMVLAVSKNVDNVKDAINISKDIVKTGERAKEILNNLSDGYELIDIKATSKYLKDKHPVTGIMYNLKKLEYSDGRKIQGIFPKFESKCDVKLPANKYKASSVDHKKVCFEELQEQVKNIFGKTRKNFTKEELKMIKEAKSYDDLPEAFTNKYTWHHSEEEGVMQLVDAYTHSKSHHTGGMSLWGQGY